MSDTLATLKQPRWLALLIMLPVAMALCVVAANWQYQRHVARSAQEATVTASRAAAAVPLDSVLSPGEDLPPEDRFKLVTVTGTYTGAPVIIRNRALNSERGMWVVDPLRTATGDTVLVLRGWMAANPDNVEQAVAPPAPQGTVDVTGALQPSEPKRGPGVLSNGEATSVNTQTLCPEPSCYQAYVQLTQSQPADTLTPIPVQGPGLGPHLGYAGQWLIFMLLLPVGFVVLLRREVRDSREQEKATTG